MGKWMLWKFGCELLLVLLVIAMLIVALTGSYLAYLFILPIPILCSLAGINYYAEKELDG